MAGFDVAGAVKAGAKAMESQPRRKRPVVVFRLFKLAKLRSLSTTGIRGHPVVSSRCRSTARALV
jgi:hypothetical protein